MARSTQPLKVENIAPPIQPNAEEEKWHADQRRYWERQLRVAKWLDRITVIAAVVGLAGLFVVKSTLDATKQAAGAAADQAKVALETATVCQLGKGGWHRRATASSLAAGWQPVQ